MSGSCRTTLTSPPSTATTRPSSARSPQSSVACDTQERPYAAELGSALLQRIRETADPSLYAPAAAAFDRAKALAPDDALVWAGIATLQLGKHQFADALDTARRAIALAPRLAVARALEVDALVELGRYDDADEAASAMLGLAPPPMKPPSGMKNLR